jgi:hypothetical protein
MSGMAFLVENNDIRHSAACRACRRETRAALLFRLCPKSSLTRRATHAFLFLTKLLRVDKSQHPQAFSYPHSALPRW